MSDNAFNRRKIYARIDFYEKVFEFPTGIKLDRSRSSVVNNTLDYQSMDPKIDPRFSGLSDETLNRGPISI